MNDSARWWARDDDAVADGETPPAIRHSSSPVAFWALLTFTFILTVAPQAYFPILISLRIALVTAAVGIGAHLLERVRSGRSPIELSPDVRPALWLALWSLLSVPFSLWPGGSLSFLLDQYLKALAVFYLLTICIDEPRRLKRVAWVLSLIGLYVGVVALRQYRLGEFMQPTSTRIQGYNAPLTMNPNDVALILNIIFPLTIGLLAFQQGLLARLTLFGAVIVQIAGVVVTFSRGGFLALGTIFLVYQWKLFRRARFGLNVATIAGLLLVIPVLPSGYVGRILTIGDIDSDVTGSAETRWSDMKAAVSWVSRSPVIGAGVGMDGLALNQERGETWLDIHNVYLQYAVDLGLPGLLLFLTLFVLSVRSAREAQALSSGRRSKPGVREISEGLEVSLLGFAVSAFFHPVAFHFDFYYLAGLAMAARRIAVDLATETADGA